MSKRDKTIYTRDEALLITERINEILFQYKVKLNEEAEDACYWRIVDEIEDYLISILDRAVIMETKPAPVVSYKLSGKV